ncbi:MAG TPA: response regulator transcription factor [Gemmatimonadaceae bacterium]
MSIVLALRAGKFPNRVIRGRAAGSRTARICHHADACYSFEVLPCPRSGCCFERMTIRVLVVDDHPLFRAGVIALLAAEADIVVVAEGRDAAEGIALHASHHPDVTLMDLRMPGADGIAGIRAILAAEPAARVIALTTYDGDADIYRALDAGACGYMIKDTLGTELVGAVRIAVTGRRVIPPAVAVRLAEFTPRVDLTPREVEVLRLTGKGLRNREIARVIGRTEETVKLHLKHVMAKLDVADRTEAVTLALQRGIIHLDD